MVPIVGATADTSSTDPNEWRDRARENYAAAKKLTRECLVSAAASRLYYALFQGIVARLLEKGFSPNKLKTEARSWEHGMVCLNAGLATDNRRDRVVCTELRTRRESADYLKGDVLPKDVEADISDAADILNRLRVV